MSRIRATLYWLGFGTLCVPLMLAPWFFGAWEMWWFWPFVVVLALSTAVFGVRLLMAVSRFGGDAGIVAGLRVTRHLASLVAFYLAFLLYAAIRAVQADVHLDAERALLLFVTPFLVAIQIAFGLKNQHVRWLFWALFGNLSLLALYGIANHAVNGSRLVLWVPSYARYAGRATGSYFCPDHYAGICELLAALCLGVLFARQTERWRRGLAGAFLVIAAAGVVLSQSRGGGLTLVVLAGAILVCGMWQWPVAVRWYTRSAMVCAVALALLLSAPLTRSYVNRFCNYVDRGSTEQTFQERSAGAAASLRGTPRGRMIGAAIRSWRSAPWFGIGPGMHRNAWPHIAPTSDGDRETNRWPSQVNHDFYSYEVHSDWVQLLQEHGVVGFALFLAAAVAAAALFLRGMRRERSACESVHWVQSDNPDYGALVGGGLALLAMTFHSLGDFNLQMPATTWVFAAILAVALRAAARETANGLDVADGP